MTGRTARQRYRRRLSRLKASAGPDCIYERWGWGNSARTVRGDLRLLRQAIAGDWDIPEAKRAGIVSGVHELLRLDRGEVSARVVLGACRAAIEMEGANQRDEHRNT